MNYDSLGQTIVQRTSVKELSGRDKVSLVSDLLNDLGIMPRITQELSPEAFSAFNRIWVEQVNIAWDKS